MTADWLVDLLAPAPDRALAVISPDGLVTYRELRSKVTEWRKALATAAADGPVAVQLGPSVTTVAVVLAVLGLGTPLQLVDPRLSEAERERHLRAVPPAVVVTGRTGHIMTRFEADPDVKVLDWAPAGLPGGPHALVQFSSGSTGEPKVIGRRAEGLRAELAAFADVPGWTTRDDVVLVLNSLAHSFGLLGAVLHGLRSGATLAFARSARPHDLQAAAERLRPTLISGVPAHFDLLATLPPGTLRDVRAVVSGGELMSERTYDTFTRAHGVVPGQSYGLTELGMVAMDVAGAHAPAVGPVIGGHDVVIDDGEVTVATPASPYLTSAGSERYRDGRLHTGDRGNLDQGVLRVRGRSDPVVVVGGLKFELSEVEAVLRAAPGVDEVVVVSRNGVVEAYVGSRSGATPSSLHRWCAQRLANFKRPSTVVVRGALPRTVNGKLVRRPEVLAGGDAGPT
ncbi:class I adenylate-forming enzyme family protein [Symbioplanes lichenis]|uniref:class I adenylate-forming enzyme family protein n=1 Tax=Symbioplanes lichenis TaxID=1629072 RepID=UPI002738D603|nr:fatty acid--CoA ligase family protein [Actinoplanes lichenis]